MRIQPAAVLTFSATTSSTWRKQRLEHPALVTRDLYWVAVPRLEHRITGRSQAGVSTGCTPIV